MNGFHKYYQGKLYEVRAGVAVKGIARDIATGKVPNDKQLDFYKTTRKFFVSKMGESNFRPLRPPRNGKDCGSKINAMLTIIRKKGWEKEFFDSMKKENEV